jgi:hypothetical protein
VFDVTVYEFSDMLTRCSEMTVSGNAKIQPRMSQRLSEKPKIEEFNRR